MDLSINKFNFHDLVQASVSCDSSFASEFFLREYQYHATAKADNDLPMVNLEYRLNSPIPDGFTHYRHKILANMGYTAQISDGRVDLSVSGNKVAVPIAHHMLLHSAIRWLAANNNALLLHAGSVAKNGKSIIFSGKGGAGKTTTTSLILSSSDGWQIHADDYVFLKNGQSLAYVTRSHLYKDLLSWVPEVSPRLTTWERVRLEVLGQIRKHTQEGIKWPVRLSSDRLWPDVEICDHAQPAGIFLLERENIPAPKLIQETDIEMAVDELIDMNFYEARHFIYLLKKSGTYTETWLNGWKDKERNSLLNTLKSVPVYHFILPSYSDRSRQSNEITSALNELVK